MRPRRERALGKGRPHRESGIAVELVLPLAVPLLLAVAAGAARAQELQVQVPRGPHYAGVPIEIQLVVNGFEEQPEPSCSAPDPPQGTLRMTGISPSVTSSVTIIGGRITRVRDVRFVCRFVYEGARAGPVQLGPFLVTQASKSRRLPPVRLSLRDIEASARLGVSLRLPAAPVYVGQRIPVELEFRLEQELQENLQSYALRVPFFAPSQALRFVDPEEPEGETRIDVQTGTGDRTLQLQGNARDETIEGKRMLVVTLHRTLVPLRSGSFEVMPSSLVADEGTRWRRDFFGRRATQVRKWRAMDRGRRLEVRELPTAGMPPSFSGAVGRGFSLEVSADRSVVQVGEPITLSLRLRGDGNLETAGLPRLDSPGLLPADRFRVPANELTGHIEADTKEFSAVVRVLDEEVREIPGLEFAWFDPDLGAYRSTRSRPIALSVRASQVVGAAEVMSETAEPDAPARTPPSEETGSTAPPRRTLALTGADLAIERDPTRLLRGSRSSRGGAWLSAGLYTAGVAVLGLAWFDRRRSERDPRLERRRAILEAERRRVRDTAGRSEREAVAEIAGALRRMRAECPDAASAALESFLGECDARSYAPQDGSVRSLAAAFHERAVALADAMAELSE